MNGVYCPLNFQIYIFEKRNTQHKKLGINSIENSCLSNVHWNVFWPISKRRRLCIYKSLLEEVWIVIVIYSISEAHSEGGEEIVSLQNFILEKSKQYINIQTCINSK